jgi:hypothetical protein
MLLKRGNNMAFLTEAQVKELERRGWDVSPEGAWLDLYPEDFASERTWGEVCSQLNVSTDTPSVAVCYVGVISDIQNINEEIDDGID